MRLAWAYLTPHGADLVDLHVYVSGPATLGHGNLYEFTYPDKTPDFPLPFTYPPFAAVVFWPLHLIPFTLLGLCWILGTIAALYAVVRLSQRLLGFDDARAAAVWTAVTMWTEPVRSTLDYGQINVLLMLLILLAVASSRWWISGTLIGLAGGVKLTPLVSGLYFLGARRWTTAIWAGVVFLLTVAVGIAVVGSRGGTTSPICWVSRTGSAPSPPCSTSLGGAGSPGSSGMTRDLECWCCLPTRSPPYSLSWHGGP